MRTLPILLSTVLVGALLPAQKAEVRVAEVRVAEVQAHIETATKCQADQDVGGVMAALRDADEALAQVPDVIKRSELREQMDAVIRPLDPLFDDRRDLTRALAERFAAVAKQLLDAGMPRTAMLAIGDVKRFDAVLAAPLAERAEADKAKQVKGSPEAKADTGAAILLQMTSLMKVVLERAKELNKELPVWIETRIESAGELAKLAARYEKKKELELAYEVLADVIHLDGGSAPKSYSKLVEKVSAARAKRRYEAVAKPSMDELRKGFKRFGSKKSWKFKGMEITAPQLHPAPSILVSTRRLTGDYRVEVDVQIVQMVGKIQLIAAWQSKNDYTVLEFERPRASYSMFSLVHYAKGKRNVLAEQRGFQTMASYFRLAIEVKGGQVSAELGKARCQAELPTERGEGTAVGFLRPARKGKALRGHKKRIIRLRNFVLRVPE